MSHLYTILKQSDTYLWTMEILYFNDLGDTVSFGCDRSCSSVQRIRHFGGRVSIE